MAYPPITKDALLDELRTIFLFEADHLAMGKGSAAAEAFIGFASEQYYCEEPVRVDLQGFRILGTVDAAYDYAFQVGAHYRFSEDQLQDFTVFLEGTPRVGGQGVDGGQTHPFMTPDGCCRRTLDAATARFRLDEGDGELTVRHLALLANMTEGAVRNALAAAGIKATGSRTTVPIGIAAEWLKGRRGFVETKPWSPDAQALLVALKAAMHPHQIGSVVRQAMDAAHLTEEAVAARLGWATTDIAAWCAGGFGPEPDAAAALAATLDLDPPLFAGRVVETALRARLQRTTQQEA